MLVKIPKSSIVEKGRFFTIYETEIDNGNEHTQ